MDIKLNNALAVLFIISQVILSFASPTHKRNFHPKTKPFKIAQKLNKQTINNLEELLEENYVNNQNDNVMDENYEVESTNSSNLLSQNDNLRIPQENYHSKRHPLLFDWTTSCGECDSNMCDQPPTDCPSGLIRDACDCCYVCGNLEDTPCDLDGDVFRFGFCGKGLFCAPVSPRQRSVGIADAYCACISNQVICGNDGRTYSNPCRFKRTMGRKVGLKKAHDGPCLAAPLVEIPPMNQTVETGGSSAVFSCSVSGYPLAWFEWLVNGENVFRLGLSDGISIQIRSGPLQYHVTTWLEIDHVTMRHAGLYTCVAKNTYGFSNASARLNIIEGEYAENRQHGYKYRGIIYNFDNQQTRLDKTEPELPSDYLRNHILPESKSRLAYHESASHIKINDVTDKLYDVIDDDKKNRDVIDDEGDDVTAVFVKALEEIVKPKTFKDIFFDDDDISEGSGIQ